MVLELKGSSSVVLERSLQLSLKVKVAFGTIAYDYSKVQGSSARRHTLLADGQVSSRWSVLVPDVLHDLARERRLEARRRRRRRRHFVRRQIVVGHLVVGVEELRVEAPGGREFFGLVVAAARAQLGVELGHGL